MPSSTESKSATPVIVYNGWGRIEVHPLSIETVRGFPLLDAHATAQVKNAQLLDERQAPDSSG